MNVGELFIKLGVTGTGKAVSGLTGVKNTLGDVKSGALATKAAIAAALYGLERLMSASARTGTELQNFQNLTGLSAEKLQQHQHVLSQYGATYEEVTSSIKGVQAAISSMKLGEGAPKALGMVAKYSGGIDMSRVRDAFYMTKKIQEFVQNAPADLSRALLPSFGLSEGVIAAMHKGAITDERLRNAPKYNDKEQKSLANVDRMWSNLGRKIQMSMGHLTAKHGPQMIKDISMVADKVLKLVDALVILSEKLRVFELIGMAFDGWSKNLGMFNEFVTYLTGNVPGGKKGEKKKPLLEMFEDFGADAISKSPGERFKDFSDWIMKPKQEMKKEDRHSSNTTVNQKITINGVEGAEEAVDGFGRAVNAAYRQIPSPGWNS